MRERRSTSLLLLLLALAAGLAWAGYFLSGPGEDPDTAAIRVERLKRRAMHAAGQPLPGAPAGRLEERLRSHGIALGAPAFIRVFKREFELELWLERDGRFHRFEVYPICTFSGGLGPKLQEGDRQAPEGFYTFDGSAMNPRSRWHRSFNIGFPNALDRSHGRTGTHLMVHGGCSSVGCYAMTDEAIDDIWRVVAAALSRGQARIHVHAFPFRPTEAALKGREKKPWIEFWRDLTAGYEAFETTQLVPRVRVCQGRYQIDSGAERVSAAEPIRELCTTASDRPRPEPKKRIEAKSTQIPK